MLRIISFITILQLCCTLSIANPKRVANHGNDFSLTRDITIKTSKTDKIAGQEISNMLNSVGVKVKNPLVSFKKKPKIILEKVKSISGIKEPDALQIKVSTNAVNIYYTNEQSKKLALTYLKSLITDSKIAGVDITDWRGNAKSSKEMVDAATEFLTTAQIESKIKALRAREVMVSFADAQNWRLESDAFKLINPNASIYPDNNHYTTDQIVQLYRKLEKNRIIIVPVIELITPNQRFEQITGHTQFSVEGMRFVRAIIEEYAEKLQCKKICLGTLSDQTDKRYLGFIKDIATRCQIELIINE